MEGGRREHTFQKSSADRRRSTQRAPSDASAAADRGGAPRPVLDPAGVRVSGPCERGPRGQDLGARPGVPQTRLLRGGGANAPFQLV
eukprot:3279579-Prymnesium_polylepis.1